MTTATTNAVTTAVTTAVTNDAPITLSLNNLTELDRCRAAFALADHRPAHVEILWDNFSHLTTAELVAAVAPFDVPVGFHVMWSRFNERQPDRLDAILGRLRDHVDALDALYVSDHFASFTTGGHHLPVPVEPATDEASLRRWADRIDRYQSVVGRPVLIENGAVLASDGAHLADVFADLRGRSGCGLLFDISNAVISEINDDQDVGRWVELLAAGGTPTRCHIGGFRSSGGYVLDTHDQPVHARSVALLERLDGEAVVASITLERDREDDPAELAAELVALRTRRARTEAIPSSPASTQGSLSERLVQAAQRYVYLGEPARRVEASTHDAWVSPLLAVIAGDEQDRDALRTRLLHAGRLWLFNWDLHPERWLVLSCDTLGTSIAFFRPCQPGGDAAVVEIDLAIQGHRLADGLSYLQGDAGLTPEGFEALAAA